MKDALRPPAATRRSRAALTVLALLSPFVASASDTAPGDADYQRSLHLGQEWMYLTRDLPFAAKATHDGRFYYRKTVPGGFSYVIVDPKEQRKRPAFDQARLAAALGKATGERYEPLRLPFRDFEFADEGRAIKMKIGLAEPRPWRCELKDYTCARDDGTPSRPRGWGVVRDMTQPADNAPRRSPDGKWEVFAQGHDLVIRAAGSLAQPEPLTRDGRADAFYDPESIAWSPDSRRLAVYRVKPGTDRRVTRVESTPRNQIQPLVHTQLYPKPGDEVDIERPVLIDVDSRTVRVVDDALFPNPLQLWEIQWRKDGASFAFEYIHRGFKQVRVISVDAASGQARVAVSEDSPTFVNAWNLYRHDVGKDGNEVLWISERDGWRHLYLFDDASGQVKRQITRGEWVVRDVVKVDDDKRQIWFTAGGMDAGKDPYLQHYFRVDFDGGNLTRLTQADAWHDVAFSSDMAYYLDTYSRVDLPPVSELRRADGSLVSVLERADVGALRAAGWNPPQIFAAKGRDGATDIWGIAVRPRDHDPSKRYPVIESIYAGPHGAFVPKRFWPFDMDSGSDSLVRMQALADLGFIVVRIDGMGTTGRSKAFHDVAWQNLQDAGFPDRIAWHRAMAATDPSYDIGRVGIHGMSAGGQNTLHALLFHPEFYKAGVASNGCYDNRMDKLWWNEQWLGWPVNGSYSAASGVEHASKLRGDLLLIVGEQDANVDPASTLQVADALIRADKDFELLMMPGAGHSVGRWSEPFDYVQRRHYDFFIRHLQDRATPRWNAAPASP